jgi:hypothetical protein
MPPGAPEHAAPAGESAVEETIPTDGVQYEGVGAGPIIAFIFVSLLFIGLVVWAGIGWFRAEAQQAHAAAAVDLNYPDLRQVELSAARLLNQYEVVNAAQGVYRIPLDRAIDLIVDETDQAPAGAYSQELRLAPGTY